MADEEGPELHTLPGYKRIPITVVLHLYETIQEDWDDAGRFWVEENHCLDNYINEIEREMDREPGVCHTCYRGNAYLGHIPFEKIEAAQVGHEQTATAIDPALDT